MTQGSGVANFCRMFVGGNNKLAVQGFEFRIFCFELNLPGSGLWIQMVSLEEASKASTLGHESEHQVKVLGLAIALPSSP